MPASTARRSLLPLTLVALAGTQGGLVLANAMTRAMAGPLPDPQPYVQPADPDLNLPAWRAAYAQAGRPRILVLARRESGDSRVENDRLGADALWSNLREDDLTQLLSTDLETYINQPGADVTLIDPEVARAAEARLGDRLRLSREGEALRLLAGEAKADLVLLVRLLPRIESDPPEVPAQVRVRAVSPTSARRSFSLTFGWKGPFEAPNRKANAYALARAFTDDFVARAGSPLRITARVFGLPSEVERQGAALDALRAMPGAEGVRSREAGAMDNPFARANEPARESANTFEITLRPGFDADPLALNRDIARALQRALPGSIVELRDGTFDALALRVRGGTLPPPAPAPTQAALDCAQVMLSATPVGEARREQLRRLAQSRGADRFVVLVNRAATPDEIQAAGISNATNANLVVVNASSGTARPANDASTFAQPAQVEAAARSLEDALSSILGIREVRLTTVNPSVARGLLLANANTKTPTPAPTAAPVTPATTPTPALMSSADLLTLLGASANRSAEVAIVGFAQLTRDIGAAAPSTPGTPGSASAASATDELLFTFQAVDTRSGRQLGFARGSLPTGSAARLDQRAIDELARGVATQLLCDLESSWLTEPVPAAPSAPSTPAAPAAPAAPTSPAAPAR